MFRFSAFASMMQQIIEYRFKNGKRTLYPAFCDGQIYQIGIEEYKDISIPIIELSTSNGGTNYNLSEAIPKKGVYQE